MQTITTRYGELIPQHTADGLRKKEILPLTFHDSGKPKSIPLEKQTTITTPVGDIPAELITLHDNGSLNRVFPLNGKLSGYWNEEDEMALAKPIILETPVGAVAARIIGVSFYDNEALRSITLCPGESVTIKTQAGTFESRIGVSFSADGTVQTVEPAKPILVETPIGPIMAYDPDAVGICGDKNSLAMDRTGSVQRIRTTLTRITSRAADGQFMTYSPRFRESYCTENELEIEPMCIEFNTDSISLSAASPGSAIQIPLSGYTFLTKPYLPQLAKPFGGFNCSL